MHLGFNVGGDATCVEASRVLKSPSTKIVDSPTSFGEGEGSWNRANPT